MASTHGSNQITVELVGGPPWGFRLGGGADFGCPLEIAKIRKKSKSHNAGLSEGDVLTMIDHQDVTNKSHGDAMKVIEQAGDTLVLQVIKGAGPSATLINNSINGDTTTLIQPTKPEEFSRPIEAMIVRSRSREPSITRSHIENRSREPSVSRSITVITKNGRERKTSVSLSEPWRVDVTSYQLKFDSQNQQPYEPQQPQFQHSHMQQLEFQQPQQPIKLQQPENLIGEQKRIPPPVSPKPTFKASTLPAAQQDPSSCPVFQTWGAPPKQPSLQHVPWQARGEPAVAAIKPMEQQPSMFKVSKAPVNKEPSTWKPTKIHVIRESPSRTLPNINQAYDQHDYPQTNYQLSPQQHYQPHSDQNHQQEALIPQAPPIDLDRINQKRNTPTNHIPGMVNPLIYDDSHGDFGSNPIVRPNTNETSNSPGSKDKKIYSDSAFYNTPNMAYPTIHDQVALCKEIAHLLESGQNRRSKGGRMFTRRKQRSEEWSMTSQGRNFEKAPSSYHDVLDSGMPAFTMKRPEFGYNQVRHHPDPIKARLSHAELENIQHNREALCKHDELPPNIAFDINSALTHSHGKAGQIFAKRKQRAEKYVVDNSNVKRVEHTNTLQVQVQEPYQKLIKSPWDAAAEGNLEMAFSSLDPYSNTYSSNLSYSPASQQQMQNNLMTTAPPAPALSPQYKPFKSVKLSLQPSPSQYSQVGTTASYPKNRLETMIAPDQSDLYNNNVTLNFNNYNQGMASQTRDDSYINNNIDSYRPVHTGSSVPSFVTLRRPKDYVKSPATMSTQQNSFYSPAVHTNQGISPVSAF